MDKYLNSLLSTEMELVDLHSLRNVCNLKDLVDSLNKPFLSSNLTINPSYFTLLSIIEVQLEYFNKMDSNILIQAKEL